MYKTIPTALFRDTICLLKIAYTTKQLSDKICVSNQWLYDTTTAETDTVRIKKDKWQAIKTLAQETATKQADLLNQLKDY